MAGAASGTRRAFLRRGRCAATVDPQLPVGQTLDLTDPDVCRAENVTHEQLVGDDRSITQAVARRARTDRNVIGMRAPSAALDGAMTFVIFHHHLAKVVVTEERIVRIVNYLNPERQQP